MTDHTQSSEAKYSTPVVARRSHLGILSDPQSGEEVPGSVLFIGKDNEPLGLDQLEKGKSRDGLKRGPNGVILDPQPDDHESDPLNWPRWRRECALWTIGLYSLIGGGQTPILAAGFNDVAETYGVTIPEVALTTGVYMLGLAIGAMIVSPFAIIYGKRPLYLVGAIIFCAASLWSAASPSYISLVIARVVMGIGVSPCECLPSSYLSEIFYLHERGFRLGIYTLLLLGGKNLVPLVSGVIIETKGWRWVFWIVGIIIGALVFLLFLFVPETYWVRYAHPPHRPSLMHRISGITKSTLSILSRENGKSGALPATNGMGGNGREQTIRDTSNMEGKVCEGGDIDMKEEKEATSNLSTGSLTIQSVAGTNHLQIALPPPPAHSSAKTKNQLPNLKPKNSTLADLPGHKGPNIRYTRHGPKASFKSQLTVWNGRLREDNFWKAMIRPLLLFSYPAILWSTVVYSLSVVWLIVLSETVAHIYQRNPYNFTQLQTGMVYISPFIGGVLGSAVAGRLSDVIVKFMAKKNNGLYEPEFRLVMSIGVMFATSAGLMGFGWSAYKQDFWIIPTVFFGIISFGCSLGSTTAITFAVDSYRQYAAEALVTLNFSKNILGLAFSLFWNDWLEASNSKVCFLALGGIQLFCLLWTIPLYIFGKRMRAWTVRKNLMGRLE
ncbi:hypothetical protein TWF102_003628 [Orbilia oligospora]|uniref:Major facilitator superfamily (MFS) profile domain-containing protein n=1 Tax=Orbilia oligospora TaxID=2813651 RepID=A0A7C8NCL3_ORBOL|nr:hypothetical protein TWF103_004800 [Orbilia oligospora]KAF3103433.1 hypothetical protein TWF102_003628 [Orbilia oligospora]